MNRFDRAFWQLRDLEKMLSPIQSRLRSFDQLSRRLADQYAQLASLGERFTLPSDYLNLHARLQEALNSMSSLLAAATVVP